MISDHIYIYEPKNWSENIVKTRRYEETFRKTCPDSSPTGSKDRKKRAVARKLLPVGRTTCEKGETSTRRFSVSRPVATQEQNRLLK